MMKFPRGSLEKMAAQFAERERDMARHIAPGESHSPLKKNIMDALAPHTAVLFENVGRIRDTVDSVTQTINLVQEWMNKVKDVIAYDGSDDVVECLISRIEDLMLTIFTCSRQSSLADMVTPLIQYLKTFAPSKSMFMRFKDVLVTILTEDVDGEAVNLELDPHGGTFSDNWQAIINGPFGKRFASALNLLIMVGAMPAKQENMFSIELFKVLNVQALRKEQPSVLHHLFSTMDWVVDSVIPAMETKNWSLLFFDSDLEKIDELYRSALDVSNLYMSGQMDKVDEKYGLKDEAEILIHMTMVISAHDALSKRFVGVPVMRKSLTERLIKLDKVLGDLQAHWKTSAIRVQPLAIMLRGGSSVGKSALAGICAHTVCQANKFAEGPEFTCYLNGADKYQSDFRSQHVCVIFDDMGNTKPERCIENPLFILIQFINNIHCAALSPIAELKGKNDIRCKLVIVTTNTEDLHASHFSMNAASILRRFTYIVDVELKPEAAGLDGGIHERYAGQSHPDVWSLRVHEVSIQRSFVSKRTDIPILVPRKQMNVYEFVDLLADESPKYFAKQNAIVASATNMKDKKHCFFHPYICLNPDGSCPACVSTNGPPPTSTSDDERDSMPGMDSRGDDDSSVTTMNSEDYFLNANENELDVFKEDTQLEPHVGKLLGFSTNWRNYEDVIMSAQGLPWTDESENLRTVCLSEADQAPAEVYDCWPTLNSIPEEIPSTVYLSYRARISEIAAEKIENLKDLFATCKEVVEKPPWRKIMKLFIGTAIVGLGLYTLFQPPVLESQGAVFARIELAAKTPTQYIERDDTYAKVVTSFEDYPDVSKSMNLDQLHTVIDKNLAVVTIQEWDADRDVGVGTTEWCNAFPVGGARWMTTGHQFKPDKTYICTFRFHPDAGVKRFKALVCDSNLTRLDGADAVVLYLPAGGDNKDLSKLMYERAEDVVFKKGDPLYIYHAHQSVVFGEKDYVPPSGYKLTSKIDGVESYNVKGVGQHELLSYTGPSHEGMCGSLVFRMAKHPVLMGFHSAGRPSDSVGAATMITKDMITKALVEDVYIAESTQYATTVMGKEFNISNEVHYKNPVHYLEGDLNMEAIGQHDLGLSSFSSDIRESCMAPALKEVLNYEPTHTSPQKKSARPSRHRHMSNVSKTEGHVHPKIMKKAIKCMKKKLSKVIKKDAFKEFIFPLKYEDAVNGVPGEKGFDVLNLMSSMGFPLNSPKWKYILECALKEEIGLDTLRFVREEIIDGKTQYVYDVVFDTDKVDVKGLTEDAMDVWMDGKRVNVTFRANLKDEPVKFKKVAEDKIRVFAGAPVFMVIACRMITLPLINMMSNFPTIFESAVGVDATGKDWDFLADYLTEHGTDRCGDGDFSAYDTSLKSEVTKGAFDVLHWMLKECGFDDDLIKIFDGMATECIYPIYENDGFIAKFFGSNPSGHPLTVIINGLCNSLLMRYAYYSMHREEWMDESKVSFLPNFHEMVNLLTYGDDGGFNVHKQETKFNMMSVAHELGRIGMVYTDASKQFPSTPFKDFCLITFLKREFKYHEKLGARVGALDKESIFKSLALERKQAKGGGLSKATICANNLNSALRELYYHSAEEFEKHLPLFQSIAEKSFAADGAKIADQFTPITEESIITAYRNTTCRYAEAMDKLSLEPHSAILPPAAMEVEYPTEPPVDHIFRGESAEDDLYDLRSLIMARSWSKGQRTGWYAHDWLVALFELCQNDFEDTYDLGDMEGFQFWWVEDDRIYVTPDHTYWSVNFSDWCAQHELRNLIPELWTMDYDVSWAFKQLRIDMIVGRHVIKRTAQLVSYAWDHAQGPHCLNKKGDEKAFRLIRKLMLPRVELPLPKDVNNYISSFFEGSTLAILYPQIVYVSTTLPLVELGWHAFAMRDVEYETMRVACTVLHFENGFDLTHQFDYDLVI